MLDKYLKNFSGKSKPDGEIVNMFEELYQNRDKLLIYTFDNLKNSIEYELTEDKTLFIDQGIKNHKERHQDNITVFGGMHKRDKDITIIFMIEYFEIIRFVIHPPISKSAEPNIHISRNPLMSYFLLLSGLSEGTRRILDEEEIKEKLIEFGFKKEDDDN